MHSLLLVQEVAPNLRTPVAGASAFWQKSQSDACPGCYPDIQFKPFNLGAISATDMARHKDRLMSLTEVCFAYFPVAVWVGRTRHCPPTMLKMPIATGNIECGTVCTIIRRSASLG